MSRCIRYPERSKPAAENLHGRLKVGHSVAIKAGVKDPDYGIDIGGWRGTIIEITPARRDTPALVLLKWDSLTLKSMPADTIQRSEEDGLDWTAMILGIDALEPAAPRDTRASEGAIIEQLSREHAWDYLGPSGRFIREVLHGAAGDDDMKAFEAWHAYLAIHLHMPFEAVVAEAQGQGPLRAGSRGKVLSLEGVDDPYGVLVNVLVGREVVVLPLCDLDAQDQESANYRLTDAYAVWFANR